MVVVIRFLLPCADYYIVSRPLEYKLSANADINGDGNVNIQDITTLINMLLSAD